MAKINEIINIIITILLILFGVFLAYQIIRKIFGGSLTMEELLLSFTILIITSFFVIVGFLINQSRTLGRLESNFNGLKNSFSHLTTDFKYLAKDFKEHLSEHRK